MTDHDHELDDFRQRVDRIHAATPGSQDAPPDLWQRVRGQVETTEEGTSAMSSISMPVIAPPLSTPVAPTRTHRFARYANLAATFALVFAVAIGGWFAALRLNNAQPEPRFAVAPGTPEVAGATCDVEPLSLEEAMVILVNPYQFMDINGDYAQHVETLEWLKDQSGQFGQPPFDRLLTENPNGELEQDELDKALNIGDAYLACVQHGSRGQVFRLIDPVSVHEYLRGMLPLFTTEEEARTIIEQILNDPGNTVWTQDFMDEYLADKTIRVSRNRDNMYIDTSYAVDSFLLDAIVIVPVAIHDGSGEIVFETAFGGFPVTNNGRASDYARNVSIAKSPFNGEWYVFNIYSP